MNGQIRWHGVQNITFIGIKGVPIMLYQLAVLIHHGFVLSYMKITSQGTTDKPIDLEFSPSFNYITSFFGKAASCPIPPFFFNLPQHNDRG
jgi:hypothetical protein